MRKKIIAMVIFCGFLTVNIQGIFIANGGDGSYIDEPGKGLSESGKLGALIQEGAVYFLESKEHIIRLSKEIERTEQYSENLNEITLKALESMEQARKKYSRLVIEAAHTPLNSAYIEKVKNFDYSAFQTSFNLIPCLFDEVKGYLEKGDMGGFWLMMRDDLQGMCKLLKKIKNTLNEGKLPVWAIFKLNSEVCRTHQKGGYAAMVFLKCRQAPGEEK